MFKQNDITVCKRSENKVSSGQGPYLDNDEAVKWVEERAAKLTNPYCILGGTHLDSVKIMAKMIKAKYPYIRRHSGSVRRMSLRRGISLGFTEERLAVLANEAPLDHNGKVDVNV